MESQSYILPLADPQATLETVGGKGASLARLCAAGLPVPDGFHITTAAYRQFVVGQGLQEQILAILATSVPDKPDTLEEASERIHGLFTQAVMPEEIAVEIRSAYARLGGDPAVAVRSSATAEDLPEASFAGQQETYLNIHGAEPVLVAVRKCWASLWTARAIGYRARNGIAHQDVSLAVVVQKLVPAEAAGILFTVNPVSGARDELIVDAAWGLGEAVVGGLVTPDHLVLAKDSGRVKETTIAEKTIMTVQTEGGTIEQPVPPRLQRRRVLNDNEASELAALGRSIETSYERPMDIEWCLAGGRFYIVQARPITALPPEPAAWIAPGRGRWLHGTGSIEMISEPVSPLFATLILPQFEAGLRAPFAALGMDDVLTQPLFQVMHGYVYACMTLHLRPRHLLGVLRGVHMELFSVKGWEDELDRYRRAVAAQACTNLPALSGGELYARVTNLVAAGLRYWLKLMGMVGSLYQAEARFSKFYERRVRRAEDPDANVFLRGLEMRPLEADRALYALAQTDGEHGLENYLQEYGCQISSFDPLVPTQADDPLPLRAAIEAYRSGKESPDARAHRLAAEREAAMTQILSRLGARSRRTFEVRLAKAQNAAQLRENALFDVGLAWVPMRRYLLELGRRLVGSGTLREAEGVFWLTDEELRARAAALDTGQGTEPLADQVTARRERAQVDADLQPPYSLPVGKKPAFWWRFAFPVPELTEQQDARRLQGAAVSSGRVTAVARVIHGIEDAKRLGPGEILVTRTTTPAWTPLFARAAGLVTDLGGPLSHGSIVAREYGIPAVMGTGSATQRITDGQTITVDGQRGEVLLQARPFAAPPGDEISLPTEWTLPGKGPYSRGSIVDFLPDPVSPLFATLGRDRFNAGHERLMEWFIGDRRARMTWLDIINGYAYMSTSLSLGAWLRILLAVPRMPHLVRTVESRWRNEAVPHYTEAVAHWQARDLLEVPAGELLRGVYEIFDAAVDHLATLQSGLLGWAGGAEGLHKLVYDRLIRRPGDPDSVVLVRGYDSAPILAEKALYDLAQWLGSQADLADSVRCHPAQPLADELSRPDAPVGVDGAAWREFQTRWQAFLARYGAMIYNFDFGQPLPIDEPEPLLETLKLYVSNVIPSPYDRQQRLAEQREAAVQSIMEHLTGLKRRLYAKVLGGVKTFAPMREDSIAFIGYGYPQLRRMLKEIGRRMVQAGAIDLPEDIFWLTEREVEEAATALDRNEPLAARSAAVDQRHAEWQARKCLNPPPVLPPTTRFFVGRMNMGGFWSKNSDAQVDNLLKGTGASPGRVTAPACVLRGPEDFGQMRPGHVLVAQITTPAWTPLFAMAAGVVTDVGGPLSHGSIVAREYGIPAVMGTGKATRRIHSGQTITVDGNLGTVTC